MIITLHPDGNISQRPEYPTDQADHLDKDDDVISRDLVYDNTARYVDQRDATESAIMTLHPDGKLSQRAEHLNDQAAHFNKDDTISRDFVHDNTTRHVDQREASKESHNVSQNLIQSSEYRSNVLSPEIEEGTNMLDDDHDKEIDLEHALEAAVSEDMMSNIDNMRTDNAVKSKQHERSKSCSQPKKSGRGRKPPKIKGKIVNFRNRPEELGIDAESNGEKSVTNNTDMADTTNNFTNLDQSLQITATGKVDKDIKGSDRKAMAQYGIQHGAAKASKFFSKKLGFHVSSGTVSDFMKRYKTLMAMLNRVPTSAEMVEESTNRTFTESQKKLLRSYTEKYGVTTAAQLCSRKWRFVVNEKTVAAVLSRVPTTGGSNAEMIEEPPTRTFTETQKKLLRSYTEKHGLPTAAQLCSRKWRFVVNENALRSILDEGK